VKVVTRVQDVFVVTKVLALGIIIVAGIVYVAQGNLQNLEQPMQGSSTEPGLIALSFYSGLFSYAGWYSQIPSFCHTLECQYFLFTGTI
jgi:amino acid transporter